MLQRRQSGDDFCELVMARQDLARIAIAVAGDQHFGFCLPETIQHAAHAEVRRAGREHRANARRRQHGNQRLGAIGHEGCHAVAGHDALPTQHSRKARHIAAQPGPCHRRSVDTFIVEIKRHSVVVARQQVLGEIQRGVGKEIRTGHRVVVQHACALGADDTAEIPDLAPEGFARRHRPAVQIGISLHRHAMPRRHMVHEGPHIGTRNVSGGWRPERLVRTRQSVVSHVRPRPPFFFFAVPHLLEVRPPPLKRGITPQMRVFHRRLPNFIKPQLRNVLVSGHNFARLL